MSVSQFVVKTKISKQEQWQLDYEAAYKELDEWYPQIETEPVILKEEIQQITKKSKVNSTKIAPTGIRPPKPPELSYDNDYKKIKSTPSTKKYDDFITLEDYLSELNIPTLDEEYISALNVPKLKTKIIID